MVSIPPFLSRIFVSLIGCITGILILNVLTFPAILPLNWLGILQPAVLIVYLLSMILTTAAHSINESMSLVSERQDCLANCYTYRESFLIGLGGPFYYGFELSRKSLWQPG
jgi:hypothetical protein